MIDNFTHFTKGSRDKTIRQINLSEANWKMKLREQEILAGQDVTELL